MQPEDLMLLEFIICLVTLVFVFFFNANLNELRNYA